MTRCNAPSSSRMFERNRLATKKATSSGRFTLAWVIIQHFENYNFLQWFMCLCVYNIRGDGSKQLAYMFCNNEFNCITRLNNRSNSEQKLSAYPISSQNNQNGLMSSSERMSEFLIMIVYHKFYIQ